MDSPKKTVIIALPGKEFSNTFLMQWSESLLKLTQLGYKIALTNEYSAYVPFTRMMTLGLDTMRGNDQIPFDGKVEYDVWVTIDSDIIFTPKQLIELIEDTDKYPVVSGMYKMANSKYIPAVKEWNMAHFARNGAYEFIDPETLDKDVKHHDVAYVGMGFMACTRQVLEKIKYPYFNYPTEENEIDGKVISQIFSEDVSFCKRVTDAGFKISINTDIKLGHEKKLII
ncbi:MAG: hypothetical protein CMJ55_08250 [Planctomycetaceae bacterium]|nr:hypothetical protein [Planctomycetaceae bacterium]